MSNIVAVRRQLEEHGYDPIVIVDATLRHEIDDPEQLEALFETQEIRQAPAGTEADAFVLETADRLDGIVVSNDRFGPYRDRHPWLEDRLVPVMIVRGEAQLYEGPDEGSRS